MMNYKMILIIFFSLYIVFELKIRNVENFLMKEEIMEVDV